MTVVYIALGLVAAALIPGMEVVAAALVWLALAFAALCWWSGQTADIPAVLGVAALALLVRFLRLRVATRLW